MATTPVDKFRCTSVHRYSEVKHLHNYQGKFELIKLIIVIFLHRAVKPEMFDGSLCYDPCMVCTASIGRKLNDRTTCTHAYIKH